MLKNGYLVDILLISFHQEDATKLNKLKRKNENIRKRLIPTNFNGIN